MARHSREQMMEIVREWQASGQSKKEFCQTHGISYVTFSAWCRKVSSLPAKTSAPAAMQIVQVGLNIPVRSVHSFQSDDPPHEVFQNVEPLPELHRRLSGFLVLTLSLLSYRVPEQRVLCSRQTASPKNSCPARDFFQKERASRRKPLKYHNKKFLVRELGMGKYACHHN